TNSLNEGGTFTTEGYLTSASDSHTVTIGGYNQVPGGSTSGVNRVVGVINPNGTVNTSTQIPSADFNSIRAVASVDGQGFWVATSSFLRHVPLGNSATTSSTPITNLVSSPNAVTISPTAQLYLDGGAGAQANGFPAIDGPASVGSGLPIIGGQSASVLAGF